MTFPFNITNPGIWISGLLTSAEQEYVTDLVLAGGSASEGEVLTWISGAPSWVAPTGGGHTIEDEGTPQTQRTVMNFVGAGVTVTDSGSKTVVTIPSSGVSDGDKGDITVTATGTTWTIDNDVVTYAKMQNVTATDRLLGRDTLGAGDVEELTVTGGVEFTGTGIQTSAFTGDATKAAGGTALTLATVNVNVGSFGSATQVAVPTVNAKGLITAISNTAIAVTSTAVTDFIEAAQDAVGAMVDASLTYVDGTPLLQRAALTGDVTAVAGSNATTIANNVVTLAKMATIATDSILGRATAATGNVEVLTALPFAFTGDVTRPADSNVQTIANSVVTLAKMADVATATVFYRKTAATGAPEVQTLATLKTDLGLTGTNSGDQTSIVGITGTKTQFNTAATDGDFLFVGDITQYTDELAQDAIGTILTDSATIDFTYNDAGNTITAIVIDDSITNTKLANMAASTFKGRVTASLGDPEDMTGTQATTLLDVFTTALKGLAPASGGGTTNFLRADGTWAAPSGGSGTVTNIAAQNGVETTTGSPITTTGTLQANAVVNAQTGLTYTYVTGDRGKTVTHSNALAIAGTMPQAGASFPTGWFIDVVNLGAGTLTITPVTSTINGGATLVLATGQGARVVSDGTNYVAVLGKSSASGTGDVVGPASATDNAVVRFDATTGKLIQNSTAILGDSGNITLTNPDTTNVKSLVINQNDVTNSPIGLEINYGASAARFNSSTLVQFNALNGNNSDWAFNVAGGGYGVVNLVSSGGTLASPTASSSSGAFGALSGHFYNSSNTRIEGASIVYQRSDVTAASEDSYIDLMRMRSGTYASGLRISSAINGVFVGDSLAAGIVSSYSGQNLTLQTGGTSGSITLVDGANGDINIDPNGTGQTVIVGNMTFAASQIRTTNVPLGIYTSGGSNQIISFAHTASAVNYPELNNSATGTGVTLRALGSDVNINLILEAKGTGAIQANNDVTVPDEIYDATAWNGSFEVPTKNAIRDKFESLGGVGSNYFNTVYIDQSGGTSDTYGVLSGTINGSNALFTVSQAVYATGTLKVYLNGQLLVQGTGQDWVQTTPASGTFTFAVAPPIGSELLVEYQKVTNTTNPAITVRGISEVDFGATENTDAKVTITDAAITTTSYPSVSVYALATADHDPDDYVAEGITAYVSNIINGVSFDIIAGCNDTTWGKYKVTYQY